MSRVRRPAGRQACKLPHAVASSSTKDLKAPKLVRETLAAYGTALVTNNGKPMAMLIDLAEDENPEQLAHAIRLARARLALSEIRTASRRSSTHKLSCAEINAEIAAARAEGKQLRTSRWPSP